MSVCQKCGNALFTPAEEKRHKICFKCVPNGIEITSVKKKYDKLANEMVVIVKTKEILHKRITPSLFAGMPSDIKEVKKVRTYLSKH